MLNADNAYSVEKSDEATHIDLYESQMKLLCELLERGAITKPQYEKSAAVLKEKLTRGR